MNAVHAELRERLARLEHGPLAGADGLPRSLATGHAALDALLPGGGWPLGAVTEIYPQSPGIGELTLLLPALRLLARSGRHVVCVGAPLLPYAPALAQRGLPLGRFLYVQAQGRREVLWAAEQALRCAAVGAVLAWAEGLDDRAVRRLQLAAEAGGGCALLYRPPAELARPSPAAVRLRLCPCAPVRPARAADVVCMAGAADDPCGAHDGDPLRLELLKVRGGYARALVLHPAAAAAA